jgi:hypothetical protein
MDGWTLLTVTVDDRLVRALITALDQRRIQHQTSPGPSGDTLVSVKDPDFPSARDVLDAVEIELANHPEVRVPQRRAMARGLMLYGALALLIVAMGLAVIAARHKRHHPPVTQLGDVVRAAPQL